MEYDLPSHRLTYVVDGVEYKIYTIEEDAPITPEPEPTKEGYTFSGWIGIPETMPDHDVTVEGIFSKNVMIGDANNDGTINAGDIVELVYYIMGISDPLDHKAADVNGDGVVNAADIVQIVNIIMGK